jgi:hypothetical protein
MHAFVVGVAVGLLALGEALPTTQQGRNMRLLAWLCIAIGVAMLANGQGKACLRSVACVTALIELLLNKTRCMYALHPAQASSIVSLRDC